MSVTITITDPSSTPPEELQAVMGMLGGFLPTSRSAFEGLGASAVFGTPPPPPAEHPDLVPVVMPGGAALIIGVELDKDGIPWDGRIHTQIKSKTVEGVWKKRRNLEQDYLAAVTSELRATMMAPAPVAEVPAPAPVAEVPAPPAPVAEVPAPPAPVAEVPAPPAPPAAPGISFAEFMGHVTAGVTSSRFTREGVMAACVANGVPNLPGLINRPDLIPAVARELGLIA